MHGRPDPARSGPSPQWNEETYPALRAEADKAGAEILLADEASVHTDYHADTTCAPVGKTPVVGVAKPDPEFFARVISWAPGGAGEIVYVGYHPDNDILPAKAAGLRTAHPAPRTLGYLWADEPSVMENADWRINTLTELVELLAIG